MSDIPALAESRCDPGQEEQDRQPQRGSVASGQTFAGQKTTSHHKLRLQDRKSLTL